MEASIGTTDNRGNHFKLFKDRVTGEMMTQLIGEDKAAALPKFPGLPPQLVLLAPVGAEKLHDPGGRSDGTGFVVF